MSVDAGARAVGSDELAVLKLLALDGAHRGEVKISCSDLASDMEVSTQTASRRLQALEDAECITREKVGDGQFVELTETGTGLLKREYEHYRAIFEQKGTLTLDGEITTGMGEGRHYVTLPGYKIQFEEKLGYDPYPGTLNVTLSAASKRERSAMASLEGVAITAWEDEERTYGAATCYPATIEATDGRTFERAHVIEPDRTHHDTAELEIIAPERVRDELGLLDGDEVSVHVESA
jgi:riboflavin kinase